MPALEETKLTGPSDLEVGVKMQLLGSQGFAKSDSIRAALTAGVIIPLDSYDPNQEAENYVAGKDFRIASTSSTQGFGIGAKADADYILNQMFFFNLHGEVKYYFPNEVASFMTALLGYPAEAPEVEMDYGLLTILEFEPHAEFAIAESTSLNVGLPLTLTMKAADTAGGTEGDDMHSLAIGPSLSIMTKIGPLPVEAQVQYSMPLMGKNSDATSTISLQLKFFGKIF